MHLVEARAVVYGEIDEGVIGNLAKKVVKGAAKLGWRGVRGESRQKKVARRPGSVR